MSNKPKKIYRQGDVLLIQVSRLPKEVQEVNQEGDLILQHGEVTGHAHRIASRYAKLYRAETDARYMKVTAPQKTAGGGVELKHEEHSTVAIPNGTYEVVIHSEYVPGAVPRRVED
jgi:hypothetical protein